VRTSQRYFGKGVAWELNGMKINTFGISHDSTECVGYVIDFMEQRIVIITDCGQPNATMEMYMSTANHLVIEANHDEQMLLNGPYPTYLKERILSPKGRQSNVTCGQLLAKNWHPEMRNVFLCHLSHENNDPTVALNTIKDILLDEGIMPGEDVFVTPLERLKASPAYILNNQVIK
jgi:phosphoribosyl 1,2-cyclic phosphodiesterase